VVFNTGPYTVLPENSILITANMQSETGFPSSHQLKSYVAYKSRLKSAPRAGLSADAGLLVLCYYSIFYYFTYAFLRTLSCFNVMCRRFVRSAVMLVPCCSAWISILSEHVCTPLQTNKWLIDWVSTIRFKQCFYVCFYSRCLHR